MTSRDRLSQLLTESGLSMREFARALGRDERSMRRWLAGTQPIPKVFSTMFMGIKRIEVDEKQIRIIL